MKSAEEWATEAMCCAKIHVTAEQKLTSLTGLIKKIQIEAWQQGVKDAMDICEDTDDMGCAAERMNDMIQLRKEI